MLDSSKRLQTTISDLMKLVESFLKREESAVRNGEIARYEQFLLSP